MLLACLLLSMDRSLSGEALNLSRGLRDRDRACALSSAVYAALCSLCSLASVPISLASCCSICSICFCASEVVADSYSTRSLNCARATVRTCKVWRLRVACWRACCLRTRACCERTASSRCVLFFSISLLCFCAVGRARHGLVGSKEERGRRSPSHN